MKKIICITLITAGLFVLAACKSKKTAEEDRTYFAFTPAEMEIIISKYKDNVKTVGDPQISESYYTVDSAKGLVLHEVLTTYNIQFTVPLDEKGQLIEDPAVAMEKKKDDCPGGGTITCRLRCWGTNCTWSGCNSYPCANGECANGCTLLDCKQLIAGTGKKKIFIQ